MFLLSSFRFFKNSRVSAEIMGIPEELLKVQWEMLKSLNSSNWVDIPKYQKNARRLFDLWTSTFRKTMPCNIHLPIAHGADFIRSGHKNIF